MGRLRKRPQFYRGHHVSQRRERGGQSLCRFANAARSARAQRANGYTRAAPSGTSEDLAALRPGPPGHRGPAATRGPLHWGPRRAWPRCGQVLRGTEGQRLHAGRSIGCPGGPGRVAARSSRAQRANGYTRAAPSCPARAPPPPPENLETPGVILIVGTFLGGHRTHTPLVLRNQGEGI